MADAADIAGSLGERVKIDAACPNCGHYVRWLDLGSCEYGCYLCPYRSTSRKT